MTGYFSSTGPKFDSRHLCGSSQLSVAQVRGTSTSIMYMCTDTHAGKNKENVQMKTTAKQTARHGVGLQTVLWLTSQATVKIKVVGAKHSTEHLD